MSSVYHRCIEHNGMMLREEVYMVHTNTLTQAERDILIWSIIYLLVAQEACSLIPKYGSKVMLLCDSLMICSVLFCSDERME